MKAEFEEKQYEQAANIELAMGTEGMRVFSSGQVLESIVGYDTAADPDENHALWKLLQLERPKGLALLPNYWMPGPAPSLEVLPKSIVSLILQYKRPDYLQHGNARQWELWGEPYYRFARQQVQHVVLKQLEQRAGSDVVVRYAAPAFWRYGDLEQAQLQGQILQRTGFVSPDDLGKHHIWTYVRPGTTGKGNPGGKPVGFESLKELIASLGQASQQRSTQSDLPVMIDEFVGRLSEAIAYRNPTMRSPADQWIRFARRELDSIDDWQATSLRDYVLVQSAMTHIGAHWFLVQG